METSLIISEARRQAGLTQRGLAARAGMPQSTVARIESGAFKARAGTLERLLEALDLELVAEPRLGRGVDRSLIRRMLALTPRERIEYATKSGEAGRRLREATVGSE
jgi:transcriptional regulator with XRE-family HTH domain